MSKSARSRIVALVLALLTLLPAVLSSCALFPREGQGSAVSATSPEDRQTLQILKSDYTFSQEQQMSRIKAEYLLSQNGYAPDDVIVAVISPAGPSLIERYTEAAGAGSLAAYLGSDEGRAAAAAVAEEQDAYVEALTSAGLIGEVLYRYDTVLNGFAATMTWSDFQLLSAAVPTCRMILSDTYNRPVLQAATGTDASVIENLVEVYETGIFDSSSVSYTGKGTSVAILDSGFDLEHSVFDNMPDCTRDRLALTQKKVSDALPGLAANGMMHGQMELFKAFVNDKVPYVFDYADKDQDVRPYDSEHGTHVAGIIGGSDSVITGVAVDTQLVLMKVFPDLDEGGKTEDILAALEDAVKLGVDAINLSLGSSCGFARASDAEAVNEVYDAIYDAGISLLCAASNDYSSAYGGAQGNTNKVTNPDSATVGSPSTYAAALSVASISGTKSPYLVANGGDVIFYTESNSISGKANDFVAELYAALGADDAETLTLDYVTIPGIGVQANYLHFKDGELTGKIAVVCRGDSTFEDKALQAKNAGAAACIIYNNVEGTILMSMGKSDHIPTISLTKEDGMKLASRPGGTITVSKAQVAGPFMSDFSSWGPTPDLGIKPEITAHGGNIKSSVPNGGYDELSGTSMATPNMTGIVLLIRQFLKAAYPEATPREITTLCNQMLMSCATIVLDQDGNPYSPRKQGAGLASLRNVVTTRAYLTVDGIDRAKLELGDDPGRTGVYEMTFNVVNTSADTLTYDLGFVGMTETVSGSDATFVAEKDRILDGSVAWALSADEAKGSLAGTALTVAPHATVALRATFTLTEAEKARMEAEFPYGIYVEGFATLTATGETGVDLSIPFLAFFGDWTEAPLFDKTYYEVESEAHDAAIDDEDKIKADYYATTPYGSYFYNYIIPLGTYLYDVDTAAYDPIPATEAHAAVSNQLGSIDGISAVYAGLLRNAKTMTYRITDKVTGEVVKETVIDNSVKAHASGGTPIPNYEYLKWKTTDLGLVNNHEYTFTMEATLDYHPEGRTSRNVRDSFTFDFTADYEAPVLKSCVYEKVYDKAQKKDRYYLTLTIYDNHYTQSITPILFTSSSSYTLLTDNSIPVYSERGADTAVRIEITDYLADVTYDAIMTSGLSFSIDDYALNSNIYICQLPGTNPDSETDPSKRGFRFTKDGTPDGSELTILSLYEDEVVDLTAYLSTSDLHLDEDKDYLRYLQWESSNEKVARVRDGQLLGVKAGRTTVTVTEQMNLRSANLLINVKARPTAAVSRETQKMAAKRPAVTDGPLSAAQTVEEDASEARIEKIRFTYFDTELAYSKAGQTSDIGATGSRIFLSSLPGGAVSFYPGERIKLAYEIEPWYVEDNYRLTFASSNPSVVSVTEDGVVTALKKGSATVTLKVEGSNLSAKLKCTVNSEFVIENRVLVAYKGQAETVVIPDDEGILYVGPYAFCLYTTDNTIELTDDDYDANKIPSSNPYIKHVLIPDTVEEIQKYAFYHCTALEDVTFYHKDADKQIVKTEKPAIKNIRDFAFSGCVKLKTFDFTGVQVVARQAFADCKNFADADLSRVFAMGDRAFMNCVSLAAADLSSLRSTGVAVFSGCEGLRDVTFTAQTQLSERMFMESGLEEVDLWATLEIPTYCFALCDRLRAVRFHSDIEQLGYGCFWKCDALAELSFGGSVGTIGEQAFRACKSLTSLTLPDSDVALGSFAFYRCNSLATVTFGPDSRLTDVGGGVFSDTALSAFVIDGSKYYKKENDGKFLVTLDGTTLVLSVLETGDDVTLSYAKIGPGAMSGTRVVRLTFDDPATEIGAFAFTDCRALETVTFPAGGVAGIGTRAFQATAPEEGDKSVLAEVVNLAAVSRIGDYAFAGTALPEAAIGDGAEVGEGAFFGSAVKAVTIGAGASFGVGAFQNCADLVTVCMPEGGGVKFAETCFAYAKSLSEIDLSRTDGTVRDQTFYACTGLRSVKLAGVTSVGEYAFADCAALAHVEGLDRLEEIGQGAFARYDGYAPCFVGTDDGTVLVLPASLRRLGDGVFAGCENITDVRFECAPEGCLYLFAYCTALKNVTLSPAMTAVADYMFTGCPELETINLGHIKTVGDYAFTSCVLLQNVDLSSAERLGFGSFADCAVTGEITAPRLTEVGDYAFQGSDIRAFNAPALERIGISAFENNEHLMRFVLTDRIAYVGDLAFLGCKNLSLLLGRVGDGEESGTIRLNDYALLEGCVLYTFPQEGIMTLSCVPAGMFLDTLEVAEGTVRISLYAGCANPYLKTVVLPESLRLIGNYAFNDCEALETVEFRSFVAPTLESSNLHGTQLTEADPGFGLLHNQFDIFGLELCYYTFVDLAGSFKPIRMVLPQNENAEGYDGLIYLAVFGPVSGAERSAYVAKEKKLAEFVDLAARVTALGDVTLRDEALINAAVAALNATTQDPVALGFYSAEEWQGWVAGVGEAKTRLNAVKLANASRKVKDIQERITALPDVYTFALREVMAALSADLASLSAAERNLLDQSRYTALLGAYREDENDPAGPDPVDPEPPAAPEKDGPLFLILGIAGGVVLLAAGGWALYYFVLRKKKTAPHPADETEKGEDRQ